MNYFVKKSEEKKAIKLAEEKKMKMDNLKNSFSTGVANAAGQVAVTAVIGLVNIIINKTRNK